MVVEITKATLVQGDYGSYIQFVLYDSDDALYDLSSASSVKVHLKRYGTTTLTVDELCSIYDNSGTIRYTLQNGDTDIIGDYVGDIEVFESGVITTWTPFWIYVVGEVG